LFSTLNLFNKTDIHCYIKMVLLSAQTDHFVLVEVGTFESQECLIVKQFQCLSKPMQKMFSSTGESYREVPKKPSCAMDITWTRNNPLSPDCYFSKVYHICQVEMHWFLLQNQQVGEILHNPILKEV
jgi:hypothetical protein